MSRFVKAPGDILEYGFDWTDYLDGSGDTIISSAWTSDPGIDIGNYTNSSTKTAVRVFGGTLGHTYAITNRVVFSPSAQIEQRTLMIAIEGD